MSTAYLISLSLVAFGFVVIGICLLLTYIESKIYKSKVAREKQLQQSFERARKNNKNFEQLEFKFIN